MKIMEWEEKQRYSEWNKNRKAHQKNTHEFTVEMKCGKIQFQHTWVTTIHTSQFNIKSIKSQFLTESITDRQCWVSQ